MDLSRVDTTNLSAARWPLTKMAASATAGNNGSDVEGYRDHRGVTMVGAWSWVDTLGMGFATEREHAQAFKAFNEYRSVVYSFAALSIVAVVVLTMVSYRSRGRATKHVRELNFQKYALDEHAIVSIADIRGNITYANDKFCEISGYSRAELIGRNHRIVKSAEHPPEFYADMWKTIAAGETWTGEIQNRKKDGEHYWVTTTIVPFLGDNGRPFQYVSICTDATVRMCVEQSLSDVNSNLEEPVRQRTRELEEAKELAEARVDRLPYRG